jgi:hypothetical protein
MSMPSNSFDLTPDQIARLASLAQTTGKPIPEVLDDALAAFYPEANCGGPLEGESFLDAGKRLGFVGCIKNTPPDLSTNKSYMEGFGQNGARKNSD